MTSLSADDRLEILDLYGRYSALFDEGDGPGWASLFTPDGSFTIVGAGPGYRGTEALTAFVQRIHTRSRGLRHFVSNVTIATADDVVEGRAAVLVLRMDGRTLRVLNIGAYVDHVVRLEAGWRFANRTFTSLLDPELIDASIAVA